MRIPGDTTALLSSWIGGCRQIRVDTAPVWETESDDDVTDGAIVVGAHWDEVRKVTTSGRRAFRPSSGEGSGKPGTKLRR